MMTMLFLLSAFVKYTASRFSFNVLIVFQNSFIWSDISWHLMLFLAFNNSDLIWTFSSSSRCLIAVSKLINVFPNVVCLCCWKANLNPLFNSSISLSEKFTPDKFLTKFSIGSTFLKYDLFTLRSFVSHSLSNLLISFHFLMWYLCVTTLLTCSKNTFKSSRWLWSWRCVSFKYVEYVSRSNVDNLEYFSLIAIRSQINLPIRIAFCWMPPFVFLVPRNWMNFGMISLIDWLIF